MTDRQRAADAARAYLLKEIAWQAFIDEFDESKDPLIMELVDLVEHEPKRGGILGASEEEWEQYQASIKYMITELESEMPNKAL